MIESLDNLDPNFQHSVFSLGVQKFARLKFFVFGFRGVFLFYASIATLEILQK